MLDQMSSTQLAEWIAAYQLGIDEEGWLQTGTIAATVHNEITSALYAHAGKRMPQKDIQYPDKYNPFRRKRKHRYDADSLRRAEDQMANRYRRK